MNKKWLLTVLVAMLSALSITSTGSLRAASQSGSFTEATPESVGLSSAAVQAMAARVRELVEDEDTVGAEIMIVKNRKVVLHEAFGWRDIEDNQPMRRDTIFCIRSMTKPLVGAAVQMLIDEGKLKASERASKYLPSFDNDRSREITIEQLLTHTAGFPITRMNRAHTTYSGLREVADQAGGIGPSAKPGSGFSYSDADTETLAAIVAQVSGKPAEQFIQERLLDPLSMADTYCVLQKDKPRRDRVSSNYAGIPAVWHKYWDDQSPPFFPYFLGAAAAYSTTSDYARFLAMLIDKGKVGTKRILSEAAVERIIKPTVEMRVPGSSEPYPTSLPGYRIFYGEHMMIYEDGKPRAAGALPAFGHSGSDGTFAWAFPEQDLIVLYFTQARGGLSGFDIEAMIAPLIGLAPQSQPKRLPVEKLKSYLGCYQYAERGPYAYVTLQGPRLAVDFGSAGLMVLRWPNEKGEWRDSQQFNRSIRFQTDADGRVMSLTVPQGGKEYTFKRCAVPDDLP
ncbi:MAG TPA: serine hydrolase domain-containing protein, partial [Blastocatellia bacterium]